MGDEPKKKIEKFGTQAEKSKVIMMFRNGDKHHTGLKVTLKNYRTLEQVKEAMSKQVGVPTGAVRKIYTEDGKQLKTLDDFADGGNYVCAGAEKFNRELLPTALLQRQLGGSGSSTNTLSPAVSTASTVSNTSASDSAPTLQAENSGNLSEGTSPAKKTPDKKPVVSAYSAGRLEKFGTQAEKARVIYVFRNGDKHHKGEKITVHPTKFKTFDQLKDAMTKIVGVPTGAVRKVYTVDGKSLKALDEIQDETRYICAGAEKFNRELLPLALSEPSNEGVGSSSSTNYVSAPVPLSGTDSDPALQTTTSDQSVKEKKPVVTAYAGGIQKFGTQAEKARVIYAFRNGDKHHKGEKITIHHTKFKTFDQLKDAMTKLVQVPTGAVRKVYTVDGKSLKSLDEFVDEGKYVCAGAEKFNKDLLPTVLLQPDASAPAQ